MGSPDEGVPRIGMNVRAARRSRGVSLEALAGLTGRSKGWLSKIENGHSRLERRQDIAALAEALEVSADSLVGVPSPEIRPDGRIYNIITLRRARQAAELLGDPVWKAAAAFGRAHARSSASKGKGLMITPRLADEVEPQIGDDRFAHEAYGMLRLSAALACAVQNDHRGAAEHAAEAATLANRDGERPGAWELFGPANVGVWRTSLAVEAGQAEAALTYADQVEPRNLASHNRRAGLRLEKARAYAMLGKDGDAVRELRQAERLSPAQVRHNPLIRDLVMDMLSRARREAGGRDLRGLAWRMNLI